MKKKRILTVFLIIALLLCAGCSAAAPEKEDGGGKETTPKEDSPDAAPADNTDADTKEDADAPGEDGKSEDDKSGDDKPEDGGKDASGSAFSDLGELEFTFSSGVGAWHTSLNMHDDGTFDGIYMDTDMGDAGDDYPHGTIYYSEFDGRFTEPEKVNGYTYKFRVDDINYPLGEKEEIKDGIRYFYGTAYGIDGAEDIYLYLPGAPTAELPEGFLSWVRNSTPDSLEDTELPFYGLYNEAQQDGFSGFEALSAAERIKNLLSYTEENAAEIEKSLQEDKPQIELNDLARQLYETWDSTLNNIWQTLEDTMDKDSFAKLKEEEIQWIKDKEAAVEEEASAYEGGSIYGLIYNKKAAELTKERVYYLAELVK